ncbi:hypothetical protein F5884DRAFT_61335 [Xylogone sp. PMI_703]|nr:hypothetical protein F5884DRAFT_61335 [Xylogone sp. PMI_703]
MDILRRFAAAPPGERSFRDDKPTLLVGWWCTCYAIAVIVVRVCGRYVRAERIFREDGVMTLAIIPLLIRMALVHIVLLYGTNNVDTFGLTPREIHRREIGSQAVLASRIFYAAYLWVIKLSTSMFLYALTETVWKKSHQRILWALYGLLAATFLAVVIADLAPCQPFSRSYQVVPDPGPKCRQGYTFLVTMGILNIVTNLALAVFPIPMIMKSSLPKSRKVNIIFLMLLPLVSVAITSYQIPGVIAHHGRQQLRSLLASIDILVATFTSNAIVLISLIQDKGYKKSKFKYNNGANSLKMSNIKLANGGRSAAAVAAYKNSWGSDEDLMREEGSLSDGKGGVTESVVMLDTLDVKKPAQAKLQEIRVNQTWEVIDEGPRRD